MKNVAVILVVIAVAACIGCGDSTNLGKVTYIERAPEDFAAKLFIIDEKTKEATPVAISIPPGAEYVASNRDATAVTYCHEGESVAEIYSMGKDNVEKQLTTDGDACESTFSPNGKTIAYVGCSTGTCRIYTMNADGSNQKLLYPGGSGLYEFMPQFSPDGKSVVYYVSAAVAGSSGKSVAGRQRNSGSAWPRLSQRSGRAQTNAAAAPTENGWYRMALTDSAPTLVYAVDSYWGPAAFSADGKSLLMTAYDGTMWNIFTVKLDGTGLTPLTTGTETPSFAPFVHGTAIVFNRYNNDNLAADIYVMDQNGANQALVSTSPQDTWRSLNDTYWEMD